MSRTVFDCARVPGNTCSVQMIGDRDDVLAAAKQHLVAAHGHSDDSQLDQNVSTVVDDHQQATTYSTWF